MKRVEFHNTFLEIKFVHRLSQTEQVLPSDTAEEQMLLSFNLAKPARYLHGHMQT